MGVDGDDDDTDVADPAVGGVVVVVEGIDMDPTAGLRSTDGRGVERAERVEVEMEDASMDGREGDERSAPGIPDPTMGPAPLLLLLLLKELKGNEGLRWLWYSEDATVEGLLRR
jgi:hypothetical protein